MYFVYFTVSWCFFYLKQIMRKEFRIKEQINTDPLLGCPRFSITKRSTDSQARLALVVDERKGILRQGRSWRWFRGLSTRLAPSPLTFSWQLARFIRVANRNSEQIFWNGWRGSWCPGSRDICCSLCNYRLQTKLRQGNIYTPVGQSFCSQGGVCLSACWDAPPGQTLLCADTPPPTDGHCSGTVLILLNAFLFLAIFNTVKF